MYRQNKILYNIQKPGEKHIAAEKDVTKNTKKKTKKKLKKQTTCL